MNELIMKNARDFFSIIRLSLTLFIIVAICIWFGNDAHFKNQNLGVSITEFKADWGNPDREFIYKADGNKIVLVYDCNDLSGHNYVFKFDSKTRNLIFKYYDD